MQWTQAKEPRFPFIDPPLMSCSFRYIVDANASEIIHRQLASFLVSSFILRLPNERMSGSHRVLPLYKVLLVSTTTEA